MACAPDYDDSMLATGEQTVPVGTAEPAPSADRAELSLVDHRGSDAVEVTALDNVFVDAAVRVDVGVTVTWENHGRSTHSVESRDGVSPAFGPTELSVGDDTAVTFDEPGIYEYYCHLHGDADHGMVGVVVVGDVDVPEVSAPTASEPPTSDVVSEPSTIRVPDDAASIQEAVDAAAPGTTISIAPGVYREAVVVTQPGIVIHGEDRNTVVLDGGYELDNGIEILGADDVAIENLTVTGYTTNGLFWTGVEGYRASYVTATNNGYYGIYAFDSRDGVFEHSYASGSADSGFYIGQCKPCDATVVDVIGEYNNFGFSGANTAGVTIENSVWRHNRAGIVIASLDNELLAPQQGDIIRGNTVEDSGDPQATRPANPDFDVVYGIGIVVVGGLDNVVSDNTVRRSATVGIAVSPNPAIQINFWPAERNHVVDNDVSGSVDFDLALVAIPDLGDNCFEGNEFDTSAPAELEAVAPCSGAPSADPTVGAPDIEHYLDVSDNPAGVPFDEQRKPDPQPSMPTA